MVHTAMVSQLIKSEDWLFGVSENGYMDTQLFLSWFRQIFLKHATKERPLLLTMDNHESHVSLEVVEEARANQVELYCLPPHTTHILQPLDVVMFRPLKKTFSDLAINLGYVNHHFSQVCTGSAGCSGQIF